MKYALLILLLAIGFTGLNAENWAVSGLVTLDTVEPAINITTPQANARFCVGGLIPVSWQAEESNIPNDCIDLQWRRDENSDWQAIVYGMENTGYYEWLAPQDSGYSVSLQLTMTDAFGNQGSAVSETFAILPPSADFSASTLSGFLPLEVEFTDLCPGSPSSWAWDFDGDGIVDSHEQNPLWVYDFPGTYTVSLTVEYWSGFYTETREAYIQAILDLDITLQVPSQYPTIQAAIDAAADDDYIIVADGIYYENLQIVGKEITLASHYFIDGDTLHIDDTIIDGSQFRNPEEGSVIAILPGAVPDLSSHIIGFTITHGRGRLANRISGISTVSKIVGGGFYIEENHPILTRNKIIENDAEDEGGGSYAFHSLPNLGGGAGIGRVNPGGNEFRDNHADLGKDIYIDGVSFRDQIKAKNCSFSVFAVEDSTVSKYWATSAATIDFRGGSGDRNALTTDIWVATDGANYNSGSSPSDPFLTIDHALSLAYGSQSNPVTIHLAQGIYSPSHTGERFPLQMVSWVSLVGVGADETFLDAEASADMPNRVFNLDKVEGSHIRDLTITGGVVNAAKGFNGGGISILDSEASLSGIRAMNLSASGDGGCLQILNSRANLDSLMISECSASSLGGALSMQDSEVNLLNSVISTNTANRGAGLHALQSQVTVSESEFSDNACTGSQRRGGAIAMVSSNQSSIENSLIKGNSADAGAGIYLQDATEFLITGNRILNNLQSVASFANGGGGMYWNNGSSGLLANNLFANNTAYQGGAGYGMSALEFVNNTIVNNRANYRGGAFYLNACSPGFQNSILWGNTAASGGNQLWLQTNSSDPNISFCDVQGGSTAFGLSTGSYTGLYQNNLNINPQFISPTNGAGMYFNALTADFSLSEQSPCVNAGDPATDLSLMPFDLAGNPRHSGPVIDIGAYEYQFPILALDAPQNLSISIENEQLMLSWDRVENAGSYRIFSSDNPFGSFATELPLTSGELAMDGNRYTWTSAAFRQDQQFYFVIATSERH